MVALPKGEFWTYQALCWCGYFLFTVISGTTVFSLWQSISVNGTFALSAMGLSSGFHLISGTGKMNRLPIQIYTMLGLIYFMICSAVLMVTLNFLFNPIAMDIPVTRENWTPLFRGTLKYGFVLWAWFGFYLAGKFWKNREIPKRDGFRSASPDIAEEQKISPEKEKPTVLSLDDSFFLNDSYQSSFIRVREISHIRAEGAYSRIILKTNKNYLLTKTLKDWEEQLDGSYFVRVHRSYIINTTSVKEVKKLGNRTYRIFLENRDQPIPMSRRYGSELSFR